MILNEQTIGDLILCDPITDGGKEALRRLKLTTKDISPSFFYDKLRVSSKYDTDDTVECDTPDQNIEKCLYYKYTVDFEQYKLIKERLEEFNSRFGSNFPYEYPLLMLGVAGNGKSIEVNRRIREETDGESAFELRRAYFDLEYAFTKKTYGVTYDCPDSDNALWLFCIKLLDGIMQYIKHCHMYSSTIYNNFNDIIVKRNLANDKQKELFSLIGDYHNGDNDTETALFKTLISFIDSKTPIKGIQILLETLMLIMYCSTPHEKQYIVIDNIEQYIKLNDSKIQIMDSDISVIYKSIKEVVTNITSDFNSIEEDLGWKAFKIIVVLRRTSLGILDSALLQSPIRGEKNTNDVTGYYQIPDIWERKREFVWVENLRDKFSDGENENIIQIVDFVMDDGKQAIGTSYQSIIAPLMSYGIRRNARSQAHAAYKVYEMLFSGQEQTIDFDEFKKLLSTASRDNHAVRYMFRRALIEFQFKWSISSGNPNRWKNLCIGHLAGNRKYFYYRRPLIIESVDYHNPECVTLARRILTYLSCFPDANNISENGKSKSVVDMFATLPLYELIRGVLINPVGKNEIADKDFLQLARVLISLSDMSYGHTKSAPYVILGVNDKNFHRSPCEAVLSQLLKKIFQAGYEESLPGAVYNCSDFGVRITDAGYSFLLDWQASFSFMASLHCYTIPPLFFLKDIPSIKYVIKTVYEASSALCRKYEAEAARFCGKEVTLKIGTYLPKHGNKYVTFRQRIKDLHTNHLNLYREFIENNFEALSISEKDMHNLTARDSGFISKYISRYAAWNTGEGAPECF